MIWLVGSEGMLGKELACVLATKGLAVEGTGREIDITDKDAILSYISGKDFKWIINCAAYTDVDKAESEENIALKLNCEGAANLALAAKQLGAKLIHFSTDYVFSGDSVKPYKETDATAPVSAYGRTKLAGEKAVQAVLKDHFIFRISWLYGLYGKNFVGTMLRLMQERDLISVVDDQKGSPTCALALAENLAELISKDSNAFGVYHYSDEGVISWYDFAVKIYALGNKYGILIKHTDVKPVSSSGYPTPAKRPVWSAFDKSRVKSLGFFNLNSWEQNLESYIKRIAERA
jgi:dTDP-4-dehydrorhamnose reductase